MRPNCPVCNSIQTKLKTKNNFYILLNFYKCKNCGNEFIPKPKKNKGGCLWSITKLILSFIFLGVILAWLFNDDSSQNNNKTHSNNSELMLTSDKVDIKEVETKVNKVKTDSIKDSLDRSETLSIKTEIRESE